MQKLTLGKKLRTLLLQFQRTLMTHKDKQQRMQERLQDLMLKELVMNQQQLQSLMV